MTTYIAFLRGINIGSRKVLMEDLQNLFVSHGFSTVKTLIASGNVIFGSEEKDEESLRLKLEEILLKKFGFSIPVILRKKEEVESLVQSKFLKEIATKSSSSRNDTLLTSEQAGLKTRLQITLFSDDIKNFEQIKKKDFEVYQVDKKTLASVVYPEGKSTGLMSFIDKTFGKNSTTRNWNTIQKLISL